MDRRFNLYPAAGGVRVSGGDSGCVLAPGDRLGVGSHPRRRALTTLRMALARRRPSPDWCITPIAARSMPAVTTWNCSPPTRFASACRARQSLAACESFMKTLKYEEVYRNEYRNLADARASIGQFLEKVYNQKRLQSALGYVPQWAAQSVEAA